MVAPSECSVKSNRPIFSGKKVSKPLMEKKRRARINRCLDQLKTLLENYYTNNIRKRKLEKADILELTVKHLRNLQKMQHGTSVNATFAEYQAGYKSCLTGVNQYLLMAENSSGSTRLNLMTHTSSNLISGEEATQGCRTLDSETTEQGQPRTAGQSSRSTTAEHGGSQGFATVCYLRSAKTPHNSCTNICSAPISLERPKGDGEKLKGWPYSGNASHNFGNNTFSKESHPRNRCLTEGQCNNDFVAVISQNYWRPW